MEDAVLMLVEDKGQKAKEHLIKNAWWSNNKIAVRRLPLPVGDYVIANNKIADVVNRKVARGIDVKKMDLIGTYDISVDTKKDIQEIVGNICGKSHGRFRDECILAQNNNIKLIVLVENRDNVKKIEDLFNWQNPRTERYEKLKRLKEQGKAKNQKLAKKPPTTGEQLAKSMMTMQEKYEVIFKFCTPEDSGKEVIRLLMRKDKDNEQSNSNR